MKVILKLNYCKYNVKAFLVCFLNLFCKHFFVAFYLLYERGSLYKFQIAKVAINKVIPCEKSSQKEITEAIMS